MKIKHKVDIGKRRGREYPPVTDQIDALFKMAQALRDQGITLPAETLKWIDTIEKVKAKFPKGGKNDN